MPEIKVQTDALLTQLPIGRFKFIRVEFGTAGVDAALQHNLRVKDPDELCYIVVQQSAAGSVYIDATATRRAWTSNTAYVRSDTNNLVAVLLVFTPATSMTPVVPL